MKDTERTLKPRKRVIDPATTIIPFAIIRYTLFGANALFSCTLSFHIAQKGP